MLLYASILDNMIVIEGFMKEYFEYSAEVLNALQQKKPILALESTIISHGMPYPENLEMALAVEKIAKEHDVTPATIAVMNGKIKIGLSQSELEAFANDKAVVKASRRDLPFILAKKQSAGTTVAATLFCAHYAGIKVFATGGIGGVHRGNDQDISADLIEIARTPIAMICAGAKAILDLPRTLEFLEMMSVPVIGFQTNVLPAFYSNTSVYHLSERVDDTETLAQVVKLHWELGMNNGILITNPIPKVFNIPSEIIEPAIQKAIHHAELNQITGKALTPFLLKEICKITEGKSLQANIALIKNNVRLGAELCYQLAKQSYPQDCISSLV